MEVSKKANELFDKMMYQIQYNCSPTISELVSKECAKIVCNEFIDAMSTTHIGYCKEPFNAYYKNKNDHLSRDSDTTIYKTLQTTSLICTHSE